jgi:CBS domain-containing protein
MRMVRRSRTPPPRVRSLMTPGVVVAGPGETLADVARRMRAGRSAAVTVMADGHLVGIVTERDLLHAVADAADPATTPVSDRMTLDPCTIAADAEAAEAAERMIARGVRHLPVVEDGRVVGLISSRNLLHLRRPRRRAQLAYEPW